MSSPFLLLGVAVTVPYPERLAPPFWERKREVFFESWEEGIRVRPAVCSRKRESDYLHSRIFLKRFNRAMAEEGKPPEKLGCRRSSRLSAHSPSSSSDLGSRVASKLSPVAELVSPSPEVVSLSCLDGAQEVSDDLTGVHGGGAMVAGSAMSEPLIMVCPVSCPRYPVDLASMSEGSDVDGGDAGLESELLMMSALSGGGVSMDDAELPRPDDGSDMVELHRAATQEDVAGSFQVRSVDSGSSLLPIVSVSDVGRPDCSLGVFGSGAAATLGVPLVTDGCAGEVVPPLVPPDGYCHPANVTVSKQLSPLSCYDAPCVGLGVGGLVREEARVSPLVREAVRSQPTDGLRQPPSAPVVPASGAEDGVCPDVL
ncbi:hypothetical protein Dimus_026795 [Dionaea muscipula]